MTQAVKLAQLGSPGISTGFKNRIINGAMVIDQRNAGASVTIGADTTTYTLDRWAGYGTQASKFSIQQNAGSVTPPPGFRNYLGVTSLSAYTVGTNEAFTINQTVEGFNMADFAWGTASAKSVTLSFKVRSSLTGSFGGVIRISGTATYPFLYTISSANTWTDISVTIPGYTATTSNSTTNGAGLFLRLSLGAGSGASAAAGSWTTVSPDPSSATGATSVVGTNGATWYVTGVQLEVGTTATDFEYRDYGRELMMCQRYFEKSYDAGTPPNTVNASGSLVEMSTCSYSNNVVYNAVYFKVPKRATPTVTLISLLGVSGKWEYARSGASSTAATITATSVGDNGFSVRCDVGAAWVVVYLNGHYTLSAEL